MLRLCNWLHVFLLCFALFLKFLCQQPNHLRNEKKTAKPGKKSFNYIPKILFVDSCRLVVAFMLMHVHINE